VECVKKTGRLFEKKEVKNVCTFPGNAGPPGVVQYYTQGAKVFWFFFSKKNILPY
jgi:hypothetical protein